MATMQHGSTETTHHADQLTAGTKLVCKKCGMKLEVTAPCHCKSGGHLEWCGQPLSVEGTGTPPAPGGAKMS